MNEKKLRKELTTKFIDLGQLAHELVRKNDLQNSKAISISNEICSIEKQIHKLSGKYIPSKEEMKCPKCMTPYEENTVFCGNCGQNIQEFYETTIESCPVCNSIMKKEAKYCGVCGSKKNI